MDIRDLFVSVKANGTPKCSAVILAAGNSTRMGEDKIMLELCGNPLILRTLEVFQQSELVNEIIVVTNKEKLERIASLVKSHNLTKVSKVILGGETRSESSLAGACAVSKKAKLIAIHDGARPFVTEKLIKNCVFSAVEFNAAVPGTKINDTLKTSKDGIVSGTVNRDETVSIQTPQVFNADLIKGALTYVVEKKIEVTDDSSAIEYLGVKVRIVEGDPDNIKLTTPSDIKKAESILKNRGER